MHIKFISNISTRDTFHVISEPGDATRYDYFMNLIDDDFIFSPCKSTFRFPQKINRFEIPKNIVFNDPKVIEIAKRENCNPHTVVECIIRATQHFSNKV